MDSVNACPPSYPAATGQHSSLSGELNFVDFVPRCLDPRSLLTDAAFEPFNVLVDRANAWLRETPDLEIKTCESVEFKDKGNMINYEKMTYLDYAQYSTFFVRALRVWVVPRNDPSHPPQQIGYVNVVPQEQQTGGIETRDLMLDRFNKHLMANPIPGRILNVETQEMLKPWTNAFDPDKSSWAEHGVYANQFLFILRVFYEVSEPANEVIGIVDFVPKLLKPADLGFPELEPFSNVTSNAFHWCSQQSGIRFCNAQSVKIKMKSGNVINTQQVLYTEHELNRGLYYAHILRIAYTKVLSNSAECVPSNTPVLNLTCKTFVPVKVASRSFQIPEFETLSQTRQRIIAWVKATGARVVSAETSAMHFSALVHGDSIGHDSSLTYISGEHEQEWIFIFRLFLDGFYPEPPPELLPPMPTVRKDHSCVVL